MPRRARDEPEYNVRRIPGRRYWHIVWSERRRSKKVSTGQENYAEARQFLHEWLRALHADPPSEARTVSIALDAYLADRADAGVLSIVRLRDAAMPLKGHLGHLVLDEIDTAAVAGYRKARAGRSRWTIRKELQTLSSALRFAGHDVRFGLGRTPPPRERFLNDAEQVRLLKAAATTLHVETFVVLGLHTGARKGAILGLTWDRVDFDKGLISYVDPARDETDKRRSVVPMTALVRRQLLKVRDLAQTEWVVEHNGRAIGNIRKAFSRACKRAGLDGVIPHDLRRTCATTLAMRGVSLDRIADFLHATPATVYRHYRKFQPDYLTDVIAALESAPHGALISEHEYNTERK